MVEATGESIYRTVLATKCSILPRHMLSIIMASFALHWVLVPRMHPNQISREKNVLENEKTLGTRGGSPIISHRPLHRPQGTPSYKNRFRADSGGKGKSQTGGEKRVRTKGKNSEKSPFFMFLRTIFFSLVWDFPLPPPSASGSPKMAPGAAGFTLW